MIKEIDIFLILIIIIFFYLIHNGDKLYLENFRLFYESSPSTRNMSYDLRCEPVIPKQNYGLMNSSIQPHYRKKCLEMK